MEDLKKLIEEFFTHTKKFYSKEDLKKVFKIKGENQTNIFNDVLKELVNDGCLFFDKKKGYRIFSNDLGLAFGEIEINKAGNGFVHTKDGYKIFIKHEDLNGSLDGDKVIVKNIIFGRRKDFNGEIDRIVKRKDGKVIFEVIGDGYKSTLIPYDKNISLNIHVNKNELKNLLNEELVIVNVGTTSDNGFYDAEIKQSIGFISDPNIDIKLIASKYNIPIEFSKECIDEAKMLPKTVNEKDLINRTDLRRKNIVTIDCDNTKDRDDAVYVEKLDNGYYKLIVSIASVNYYVKPNSKLFNEAVERSTSHYPNNTCIPMFPKLLSNGICSLNENVDRLTKTCEMIINSKGEVVDYRIYNSVINSKKAMKYSEVNQVLDGTSVEGYEGFIDDLKIMEELSEILEDSRNSRNYINFDIPDIEIKQDENGKAYDFESIKQGKAERIIENFMLVTNTTIAENYSWLPFIYRIHETPNEDTVKKAIETLKYYNFNIPKIYSINEATIKKIIDKTKSIDTANIIKTVLLKSMKTARYDVDNKGHFALQLNTYCHFTSPIRRISDFIIHTLIDEIDNIEYTNDNLSLLEKNLKDISEKASKAERIDKLIEDEARCMSMAEYMEEHIGEIFEAYITEIYTHGMFAKTKNQISGKIRLEDIGEKYRYDSDKHAIISKKEKKQYRVGDKVLVLVKSASKENRTIDFEINKQKTLSK